MNLEIIEKKVLSVFEKHHLKLFSITEERLGKDKILTILIDNSEITHEILEPIHMEVLDLINDDLPDDYFLELSTVGLERELRSLEEVQSHISSFIYLESFEYTGNATLDDVVGDILYLKYFIKGQPKKIQIRYTDVKFIRLAVKF